MKKIMFNDEYGLTQAVLEGRKTQTRRIAYTAGRWRDIMVRHDLEGVNKGKACLFGDGILLAKSAYKLGETIAIAQKYEDLRKDDEFYHLCGKNGMPLECIKYEKGCSNKMFVKARAEREANELKSATLTPAILKKMWIEKWDGKLPVYGNVPQIMMTK